MHSPLPGLQGFAQCKAQKLTVCVENAGLKMAVVSNFDLRLRPLLEALGLAQLFDALIISAEVSKGSAHALQCPSTSVKIPCCPQNCPRGPMTSTVEGCATLCIVLPNWLVLL